MRVELTNKYGHTEGLVTPDDSKVILGKNLTTGEQRLIVDTNYHQAVFSLEKIISINIISNVKKNKKKK